MTYAVERAPGDPGSVDMRTYARAILNILEDVGEERSLLGATQRAVLNILEDFGAEKTRLEATQRAVLNILDDGALERAQMGDTQKAVFNILEDIEVEKEKVEQANRVMTGEITERKRAEGNLMNANQALAAVNRELESFAYSVSHDLRQPLRGITGFCKILVQDYSKQLNEDARATLQVIDEQATRMSSLIDSLLLLSRITRQGMQTSLVDVSELCRAIAAELRTASPLRQVVVTIQDGLQANGDAGLMRIAFQNLISNAWKFTSKVEIAQIEIGTSDDEGVPSFYIKDNGAGFNMKYADKLFGAFQRLHKALEFEGTGIGLATVQRVVHRHGGHVRAQAEVGKGATFFVSFSSRTEP